MRNRDRFAILFVLILINSCSFDYSDAEVEGERNESVPQVEIENARMVIERDNRLELTAAWIASFPEERIQRFRDLRFTEYGPDGDVRVSGEADEGILYFDTEDVELRGSIRFYSRIEEAELSTEFLYWENDARILRGDDDETVHILRDDGSELSGAGLTVDGRRNSVELSAGVRGVFRTDDEAALGSSVDESAANTERAR